jgi:hypothetical protein
MCKRGCLDCHFFCREIIDLGRNIPIIESVEAAFRDKETITRFLNKDKPFSRIRAIKCFCGNWDSEKIGKENIAGISDAIFRRDRKKCVLFAVYDKYATPKAAETTKKTKLEIIDRRVTRIIAVIALIIAFGSLMVSFFKP